MKTIITTESCSDIPVSMLEKLNVPMVPFSVNFPDRTVLDGELPIQEIYDFYEATPVSYTHLDVYKRQAYPHVRPYA